MVGLDRTAVIRLTMPDDFSAGLHRTTIVSDPVEPHTEKRGLVEVDRTLTPDFAARGIWGLFCDF